MTKKANRSSKGRLGGGPRLYEKWLGMGLSVVAGAAVSVQAFANGQLGQAIGSPAAAAAINNITALLLVACLAVSGGAACRAWRELRSGGHPVRIWWFFGGAVGATTVYATALSAPILGVAFLAIALVFGKLIGSLAIDALGLGPAGRQLPTPRRLLGAVSALAAVVVGALGEAGQFPVPLVAFLVAVGALVSLQQAGNAHLVHVTGEPLAMGLINFFVGAVALSIPIGMMSAAGGTLAGPIPWWGWTGGMLAVGIAISSAVAARRAGVLGLVLGTIAGQSITGLLLDAAFPRAGHSVTQLTVAGVVLAAGAALVANLPTGRRTIFQRWITTTPSRRK